MRGGEVLELGTGRRGTGLRLALDLFGAARVDGVEVHPASVTACRESVRDLGERVRVEQGDATRLPGAESSYDAVFAYHVLHHASVWREVVREAARVLRPGGRFFSCEMTARIVDSRPLRAVAFHPDDGDRPTPEVLAPACRDAGLQITAQETRSRAAGPRWSRRAPDRSPMTTSPGPAVARCVPRRPTKSARR